MPEDRGVRRGGHRPRARGLLAWQAGFEMVFVDKKPELVEALRRPGTLHGQAVRRGVCRRSRSPAIACIIRSNRAAIADEIRDAALVLTAVFDQNLPDVAETIALGSAACAAPAARRR